MESPQCTDVNGASPMPVGFCLAALVSLFVICWTHRAAACPFCGVAEVTLQKRIASFEISVVAEWQSGEAGDLDKEVPARTTFQVVSVLRGDDYAAGAEIVIDRFHPGAQGELFLLNANHQEGTLAWDRATQLTERSYAYLRDAPLESVPATERLRHFIPWLEDAETLLANDAFNEFANAKYEDMVPLGQDLPRERLRQWVFDPQTEPVRIGVYGMLLGLCGAEADALRMEQKILEPTAPTDIRLGIDGVMGGYLLLAGPRGIDVLDRAVLANSQAVDGELTAAISALRFIWEYGGEGIRASVCASRCVRCSPVRSESLWPWRISRAGRTGVSWIS